MNERTPKVHFYAYGTATDCGAAVCGCWKGDVGAARLTDDPPMTTCKRCLTWLSRYRPAPNLHLLKGSAVRSDPNILHIPHNPAEWPSPTEATLSEETRKSRLRRRLAAKGLDDEAVETLAVRLMGWVRSDDLLTIGGAYMQGKTPVLFAFKDGTGYGVAGVGIRTGRWHPFTDANADVQVLDRAREVWRPEHPLYDTGSAWVAFLRRLPAISEYVTGTFARVALAVLREMEEG